MRDGGRRDDRRKSSPSIPAPAIAEQKPSRNKPKDAHKKKEYNRNEENEDRLQKGKKGKNNNAQPKMVKPQPKKEVVEEQIKQITIPEVLTIQELADAMKIQPSVIVKKLFMQGKIVTVNQEIDYETAEEIALEFDVLCEKEEVVDVIEELLKEEEEDEEDPRAELVRRLLEYKMYKYMAQELEEREQEAELLFFKEPTIPREVAKYEEPLDLDKLLDGLTLAKLQKVFDAVMKRNANKLDPVRSRFSTIRREPISLEQKVRSVLSYAREHRHFKFSDVLERESDRLEIVVAFLAVLELMKMGRIHLVQEKLFDEMQLDTVDVDETEDEAELELSTEEGEEYARIR